MVIIFPVEWSSCDNNRVCIKNENSEDWCDEDDYSKALNDSVEMSRGRNVFKMRGIFVHIDEERGDSAIAAA